MAPPEAPTEQTDALAPAWLYHRLSSYDVYRHWSEPIEDPRVREDFIPMRPGREPAPFKAYPAGLPVVRLPLAPAPAAHSAVAVLGGAGGDRDRVDLDDLSATLFQAAGVVRFRDRPDGRRDHFRAASSAGNRHPVEVYLCARRIDGLADGVWHYDPRGHALTLIGPAPEGAAAALVLSGVPWRTCWKYAERGYRHLWWDCGTLAAQAVLAGRSRGLPVRVLTDFVDREIGRLIGADPAYELPLAVLPLTEGEAAVIPTGPAVRGELGPGFESFPLVAEVHEAGNLQRLPEQTQRGCEERRETGSHRPSSPLLRPPAGGTPAARFPAPLDSPTTEPLDSLIRRRGSARRFDPAGSVSREAVDWMVRVVAGPPPWDGGPTPDLRLLVHAVEGLPAGAYRWSPDGMELVGPADRGSSRELCLGQDLGRDAAFLLFFTTPADVELGAREYRAASLAAGIGLGRLYLAAAALGIGCSGLTFVDELLPGALGGEPVAGLAVAVVGRTAYRQRAGGSPGAPTRLAGA